MKGLGKVYPPDAQVLKDIWLSFLPGAKIGVLGLNGAGKSTLLKIMAGEETSFAGEAFPGQGVSIGYLAAGTAAQPREGRARQRRRGRGRNQGGARSLRRREREARRGPVARGDGQGPRRAVEAAGPHRRHQCVGSRLASRPRDGRAAFAAAGRGCHDAVGRRAAPGRAVPAAAAVAGPAAARRTDQPPRRRIGGVARALPEGLSRARSSRSRTIATSSTTSPAGSSSSIAATAFRTKATTPDGSSRSRAGCSRKRRPRRKRQRTLQRELDWIRMSPRAAPGQGQGAPQRLRAAARRRHRAEARLGRDLHSARSAPRRHRRRSPRA